MRGGRRPYFSLLTAILIAGVAGPAGTAGTRPHTRRATAGLSPRAPAAAARTSPRAPQVIRLPLRSALLHRTLREILVIPGAPAPTVPRPLLVLLHGRGGSPGGWLSDTFFSGLASLSSHAPAVLLVDGGNHSYFHDRADGAWGTYVMKEAIPAALRRAGADPARMAIGGISMGGFGAFDLARLHPGSFCAVGGHSAALWTSFADSAAGAFDGPGDFARHDVIAAARRRGRLYGQARIWLDGGVDDPFRSADEQLARALRTPYGAVRMVHYPGGHDGSYWHAHMARYLTFYGNALTSGACRARRRKHGG